METKISTSFLILINCFGISVAVPEQYFIVTNHNRNDIKQTSQDYNNLPNVHQSYPHIQNIPVNPSKTQRRRNPQDFPPWISTNSIHYGGQNPPFYEHMALSTMFQPHPQSSGNDPLIKTTDPGSTGNKAVIISSREEKPEGNAMPEVKKSGSNLPRRPGLPNDIPLPSINMSNVAALIALATDEDTDPTNLSFEQELLIIQTLSEVANFMGLQDMRDWLGIIFMFFISGPVMIPMFWMPIVLIILASFMIPLVVNGAGVAAAVAAAEGVGVIGRRVGRRHKSRTVYHRQLKLPLESYCLEMLSCETHNFLRSSTWSNWVTRAFKLTSVEWAGPSSSRQGQGQISPSYNFTQEEDCSKYKCRIVAPLQSFFANWYSYLFTFQQIPATKIIADNKSGAATATAATASAAGAQKRKKFG